MFDPASIEKCKAFITLQLQAAQGPEACRSGFDARPTVTISRQAGSGAWTVARQLADYLQKHDRESLCPWTVFDKNLVQAVLADHHLPERFAQYMPEKKVSGIDDAMGEILGLHPSHWTLAQHTAETILRLAQMGNAILVGRGATLIAGALPNAFHVRLAGALEKRVEHIQEVFRFNHAQAVAYIKSQDHERRGYVHKYFHQDLDDPLLYHLVVNTSRLDYDEAAVLIGQAVLRHFGRERREKASAQHPANQQAAINEHFARTSAPTIIPSLAPGSLGVISL
jgi:cytidylate kinase